MVECGSGYLVAFVLFGFIFSFEITASVDQMAFLQLPSDVL